MTDTSSPLDNDILDALADGVGAPDLPCGLVDKMRHRLEQTLALELAGALPGFVTIRRDEGEWIEAAPGGWIKILNTDESTGAITYLAKLSPGFSLPAHPHAVGEECLMLEGDLRLGDVILKAGDFHYAPPGLTHGRLKTEGGALVLLRGKLPV